MYIYDKWWSGVTNDLVLQVSFDVTHFCYIVDTHSTIQNRENNDR